MEKYKLTVANILATFQYIEESLRIYITTVNEKIRNEIKGKIPFKYDYNSVKDDSLYRLIEKFEKVNNNQALIENLKEIRPKRNKIAHSILIVAPENQASELYKVMTVKQLNEWYEEAKSLLSQVLKELECIQK